MDQFNHLVEENRKIDVKDMSSVLLSVVNSLGTGNVAGQKIERPVITFLNLEQYNNFMDKVVGGTTGSALYLQFNGNEENIFVRTGFIFASRLNEVDFAHEIRHTIDPYIKSRVGIDQILTEAFAFFQANYQNKDSYIKLLSHYYDDFGKRDSGDSMPEEEFKTLVQKVIDKILALSNSSDPLTAQRLLVQCRSLDDLFAL